MTADLLTDGMHVLDGQLAELLCLLEERLIVVCSLEVGSVCVPEIIHGGCVCFGLSQCVAFCQDFVAVLSR